MFRVPKRRALVKPEPFYFYWRYVRNFSRTRRAAAHPPTFPQVPEIAREIAREGIVTGDCSRFLTGEGQEYLAKVSEQLFEKSSGPKVQAVVASHAASKTDSGNRDKNYLVDLLTRDEAHSPDSPLIRLASDPKLLEIIAAYLGLWPRLHAAYAWLNFPTEDGAQASQLWHRDPEDLQMIKVFIYLVDVDDERGPFTYIPGTQSFGRNAAMVPSHKDRKRVLDEEMNPVFPPETHRVCTGPAKTMILADTVGYHRGGKPRKGNRFLLTFTYTSAWPRRRLINIADKPEWPANEMQRMAL